MATSGSVKSGTAGSGGASYFLVEWSIPKDGQSITGNYTKINYTVKIVAGNYWYSNAIKIYSAYINGTLVKGAETYSNVSSTTKTIASGSLNIPHNSDGTKSFNVSVSGWFYDYGDRSGSGSFTLPSIPRYANPSQSVASKTETSITMNWSADATCDRVWYSIDNGSSWSSAITVNGTSGSYTVSGLTAGTVYKVLTRVRRKDSQLSKDTSAMNVDTYSYPYADLMPNFTLGNSLTIGIFNPMSRTVTVKLKDANNNVVSTVENVSGTSVSGFNGSSVVDLLYQSIPDSKNGTYKVDVIYGSSTITKTGGKYNVNTSICSPVIGSATYKDVDSNVVAITQNDQNIVRSWSKVRYTGSNLQARLYSSLASCSVAVNGNTYNLTLSGNSASGGNASINSGTDVDAVFTLTDSRGLSVTKTVKITMSDWQIPSGIITIQRRNNFYSETDINVDANYSYIDGHNSVTITYKAKKQGTSSYTVTGTLQDNVTALVTVDNNYAWDFQITITDRFGGTVTYNTSIPRGMPIAFFDRLKNSFSIECFPSQESVIEVDGDFIMRVDSDVASGVDYELLSALNELGWSDSAYGETGIIDMATNSTGSIIADGSEAVNSSFWRTEYMPVIFDHYTVKTDTPSTSSMLRIHGYDANKNWVKQIYNFKTNGSETKIAFNIPETASEIKYLRLSYIKTGTTGLFTGVLDGATEVEVTA